MTKIKNYVCGFLFDEYYHNVLLIRKHDPEWQRGMFNGIGGKINSGESALQAMDREFAEETTNDSRLNWKYFALIEGVNWKCHFFQANTWDSLTIIKSKVEKEPELGVFPVDNLPNYNSFGVIPNLNWLIPMACMDPDHKFSNVKSKRVV